MKLIIERSVVVITPTIGSPKLADAVRSVQAQTYSNVEHLVVVDGKNEYNSNVWSVLEDECLQNKYPEVLTLPWNTGANGFNGQRIYASIPHLVNHDYVFFLDQDNWYEPDHVSSLIETMETKQLDWAYSLRKIYTEDKQYVCDDNCESLGKWPIYFTHDSPQYLIDTSAFAFRREFIQKACHLWHSGAWGEDRRFFYAVAEKSKWDTNAKHTLCYRVDGNPKSVNKDFFIEGNQKQLEYYKGQYPWNINS